MMKVDELFLKGVYPPISLLRGGLIIQGCWTARSTEAGGILRDQERLNRERLMGRIHSSCPRPRLNDYVDHGRRVIIRSQFSPSRTSSFLSEEGKVLGVGVVDSLVSSCRRGREATRN